MSGAETRQQRLERILEISRELTSTVRIRPLLRKIAATAVELTGSEGSSILLRDVRTGELRFRTAAGSQSGELLEADVLVPIEGSIAGTVLTSGELTIVNDAQADPRHFGEVGQQVGTETRSLLAVPLQIKDQRIGVLETINKQGGGRFDQEDVETLTALAAQAAVAIENARLVEALREAYEQLGNLDKLKSDFIAIASHELRTPLSLILLYADLLQEQLGDAAGPRLDAVLRAATRLKHIIEAMLNLRYLETGQMRVVPACFDLRVEVEEVCKDYQVIAQTKGVVLEIDLPDEEVLIQADEDKMGVMLSNLISNAVNFTPPGGRVHVAVRSRGDEVEMAVTDTGIGIPASDLDRIFERFYQVEDHMIRRHGGMGLGLSIVKGLVELHGGRVWVESVPDQGSRFVVALPVEQASQMFCEEG